MIEESHEINLSIYLKKRDILSFFPEYLGNESCIKQRFAFAEEKKQNIAAITWIFKFN